MKILRTSGKIQVGFVYFRFILFICLYVCVPGTCRGQMKAADPLKLEVQVVVSCCVDAENQT